MFILSFLTKLIMGKSDGNSKSSKQHVKPYRKTVLGSSNLAIFLKPSLDILSSPEKQEKNGMQVQTGEELYPFDNVSASTLFDLLKDVNKIMVKGAKLHESLKELRLYGWILPHTLILSGPIEDMKIVKHAWIKRHLKSPRGYFIKDIGMVQDFVVELIPQSPFMSLTSALFDAVADMNHQNIFPTKNDIHEYLKKHYSEIRTPEMKVIHDCLSRLIKNRRLYHNGRGYFVLNDENVLNDIVETKDISDDEGQNEQFGAFSQDNVTLPPVKGFQLNSSVTTSSSPGQTDQDINTDAVSTNKSDTTVLESNDRNSKEVNTPGAVRRFFQRSGTKSEKPVQNRKNKQKIFSCGIGGTLTDSITILSNAPLSEKYMGETSSLTVQNKSVLDQSSLSSDADYNNNAQEVNDTIDSCSSRNQVKRSKSFSGSETVKCNKEVSFALVGSPTHDEEKRTNHFKKRSYSFGVGYTKNLLRRPASSTKSSEVKKHVKGTVNNINLPNADRKDESMDLDDYTTYLDVESSFVDDSLTLNNNSYTVHSPDMIPLFESSVGLFKYENLGSELSLQNKNVALPVAVSDLIAPNNSDSLAQELRDAHVMNSPENEQSIDLNKALLSPRSRETFFGTSFGNHYVKEILQDQEFGGDATKGNKSSKRKKSKSYSRQNSADKNGMIQRDSNGEKAANHVAHGGKAANRVASGGKSANHVKVRLRTQKSTEEKLRNQKERNSLLFEEKRHSLKVMGVV